MSVLDAFYVFNFLREFDNVVMVTKLLGRERGLGINLTTLGKSNVLN